MADRRAIKAVKEHARRLYSSMGDPWPASNTWSRHTRLSIERLLTQCSAPQLRADSRILNVGSHGNSYGVASTFHVHTDIISNSMSGIPLACAADAEALPFANENFDLVICVGSVVNYCSAAAAIKELARVTKPGGYVALEFETSDSFEFIFSEDFRRDVTLVKTFYNGISEQIYVYGKKYVDGALRANGLIPISQTSFHLISPLVYRIVRSEQLAARFGKLDNLVRQLPGLRGLSANAFVMAIKT